MKNSYNLEANIPTEVIDEIRENFSRFDKSGNGLIKIDDLDAVLNRIGENVTHEELARLRQAMDPSERGVISFANFIKEIAPKLRKDNLRNSLIEAFQIFDREETGYISVSELQIILSNLLGDLKFSPPQVAYMIKMADTDCDGHVNYKEFADTMINTIFSTSENP